MLVSYDIEASLVDLSAYDNESFLNVFNVVASEFASFHLFVVTLLYAFGE